MPGKASQYSWSYVTPRRVLRSAVSAADAAPSDILPAIRLDLSTGTPGTLAPSAEGGAASRGHNAVLLLHVGYYAPVSVVGMSALLTNGSATAHATLRVWVKSDSEGTGYGVTPASTTGVWSLVSEHSVTCSTLIRLTDLPAGRYCVTVDFVTPGASVTITEQHSE